MLHASEVEDWRYEFALANGLSEDEAVLYSAPVWHGVITVPASAYIYLTDDGEDWTVVAAAIEDALPFLASFVLVEGEDDLEPPLVDPPMEARRPRPSQWMGMEFRSMSERRIAEALERANVCYFPNPRGRVGVTAEHRKTLVADFIISDDGKWGILEVDGEDYHHSAARDHSRDRLFREHGRTVVEHFDASECWQFPDHVVATFLRILKLNG